MSAPRRIALLGSTGSIGRQTLDVVRWHPDRFEVAALVANRASETFVEQVREFHPPFACLTAPDSVDSDTERLLETTVAVGTTLQRGEESLEHLVREPGVDVAVVATSGTVGFRPTLAALAAGKPVALANKETLIMAGHLVTRAAGGSGAALLPIDSEHSAIWQCLQGEEPYRDRVRRLVLTASGGAFRDLPIEELSRVTPQQALTHPTWSMGPKITVDSASLMNKGLEVIEGFWLFGLPYDQIDVLIHHQSIIHSLVEFVDGSVKAQLGLPDMRLPIQYALTHPERFSAPVASLNLAQVGRLTFAEVDPRKYPCLGLAFAAGRQGGTHPTVLNAANEVAVQRFLDGEIHYLDVPRLIESTLSAHPGVADPDLDSVLDADGWARSFARGWHGSRG